MKRFSPSDAALEGFRLTKEHPGVILTWGGVYFLGIMAIGAVMMLGLGSHVIDLLRKGGGDGGDMGEVAENLVHSWPAFIVVILATIGLFAVVSAGIYRAVLSPKERGFAYLQLGPAEFRLFVVNILLLVVGLGFLAIVRSITVATAHAAGGATAALIGGLAVIGMMIWVGVRLSMVTPVAFAEQRISFLRAWALTRGHFWSLFGAIVLAVIFYVMIWLLISFIGYAIVALAGGASAINHMDDVKPGVVIAFISSLLIQLILPILQVVMINAPLATIYRELNAPEPEAA
jgi:hypothetical protein